jgi:hypothetical protein
MMCRGLHGDSTVNEKYLRFVYRVQQPAAFLQNARRATLLQGWVLATFQGMSQKRVFYANFYMVLIKSDPPEAKTLDFCCYIDKNMIWKTNTGI